MGLSSWESVVSRLLFPLFVLFFFSFSASAQEVARYSIPLQDLKSHEVLTVNVVFEFGPEFDRVVLESTSYPEIHDLEVFRGRLQGVAYSMFGALEELPMLPEAVRNRVGFFAANIAKRQVGVENNQRLINQSIFTSHDKTYVMEFDYVRGVTLLELNKVYLKPYEIDVSYSEAHSRYKPMHFGVTVKEESNPLVNKGLSDSQESIRLHMLHINEANDWLFQTFLDDLRASPRHQNVSYALDELLGQTSLHSSVGAISPNDIENLKIVDEFLLKRGQVDTAITVQTVPSQAQDLFPAMEVRSLMYGLEHQDTWLLKYEPRGTSAFLHSSNGIVVFSSVVRGTRVTEGPNQKIKMQLDFPNHLGVTGEQGILIIPADSHHFEEEIRRQKALGIQGNSDFGRDLLRDILIPHLRLPEVAPKSCRDLFSRG